MIEINCELKEKYLKNIEHNLFEIENIDLIVEDFLFLIKIIIQDSPHLKIVRVVDNRGLIENHIPQKYQNYFNKLIKPKIIKDRNELENIFTMSALKLISIWLETSVGDIYIHDIGVGFTFESSNNYIINREIYTKNNFFKVEIDEF